MTEDLADDFVGSPLLEFDGDRPAIIEPTMWHSPIDGLPEVGVISWMSDAYERLLDEYPTTVCHRFTAETADIALHLVELETGPVVTALSHVGAPVSAALYETMIAVGVTTIVAVGSAGGLVAEHPPGTVVVADGAIRDEGTSHHYLAPTRLATPDRELQRSLRNELRTDGIEPADGLVWTTDAFFRETRAKVASRTAEGAIAVDMEMSALSAIATFRGTRHGHAVYMADTLHGDDWDPTELVDRDTAYRYRLLLAATRAAASG